MQIQKHIRPILFFAVFLLLILVHFGLKTTQVHADAASGILHPDGVGDNGTYDEGAPPEIRFMISNAIASGDIIELRFSDLFGDVDDTNLELYQDTDADPCDGTPVTFTSSLDPTNQVLSIAVGAAFSANDTICIRNFDLDDTNPASVLAIPVKTKTPSGVKIHNFGAVIHDGVTAFGVVGTVGSVVPFLEFTLLGDDLNFGSLGSDTLFTSGPGFINGGSTMIMSTNASGGLTAFIQKTVFQNTLGNVIPDWGAGEGFGVYATSTDVLVTIEDDYDGNGIGEPFPVPNEPASNPMASFSDPGTDIEIDIAYAIRVPATQPPGTYNTTLKLILAPDF